MRNDSYYHHSSPPLGTRFASLSMNLSRKASVGIILIIALLAFEMFNFDTTQYALHSLLGDVQFLGLQWASILAIAFCSIDFAGLVRLFTPQRTLAEEPKEVWYLMGAWLLGATMNAIMTWWAVSLTLLNHQFGNEVLSREQLLQAVPVFVAVLVWLTRILFIGAFTVAGDHLFEFGEAGERLAPVRPLPSPHLRQAIQPPQVTAGPMRAAPKSAVQPLNHPTGRPVTTPRPAPAHRPSSAVQHPLPSPRTVSRVSAYPDDYPADLNDEPISQPLPIEQMPVRAPQPQVKRDNARVRQRPPRPNGLQRSPGGIRASGKDNH